LQGLQAAQGFSHAATALTAHGLQGLHASSTPAMHSSIAIFFAAHGLHGLQAALATPAAPTVAKDIDTARAKGLIEEQRIHTKCVVAHN